MRRGIPRRVLKHCAYLVIDGTKVLLKKVYFEDEQAEKKNELGFYTQKNALLIIDKKSSLAYLEDGERVDLFDGNHPVKCGDLIVNYYAGDTYRVTSVSYINVSGSICHVEITGAG